MFQAALIDRFLGIFNVSQHVLELFLWDKSSLVQLDQLLLPVLLGLCISCFLDNYDFVLDITHFLVGLFLQEVHLVCNLGNFALSFSFDLRNFLLDFRLFLDQLLLLLFNQKLCSLHFSVLECFSDWGRNSRFCDSHCNNFNSRSPLLTSFLDWLSKTLIEDIELVDEYFLQSMAWTKLIDFMMNFTENPCLIICDCVILDSLMGKLFS